MSAADSLYRSFGALTLPLSESNEPDLSRLDPARDILLDLFAAALNSELAPVWRGAAVKAEQFRGVNGEPPAPVRMKLPAVPSAEALQEMKTGWPLLCVGRSQEPATEEQHGFYDIRLVQRWDVDYILCPQSIGNLLKTQDILIAVSKILRMVVLQGGHKAYRTGTTEDGSPYAVNVIGAGENCCNLYSLVTVNSVVGPAQLSSGPKYYACGMTLESRELTGQPSTGLPTDGIFEGADYDVGIGGTPEGVLPGTFYASTDPTLQRG